MVRLCLMASHGHPSWFCYNKKQGPHRIVKGCQPFLPTPGSRPEIIQPDSVDFRTFYSEQRCSLLSGFPESNKFLNIDLIAGRPLRLDTQDTHRSAVHLSLGIPEQWARQQKISQILAAGSSQVERRLELDLLTDWNELKVLTVNIQQQLLEYESYPYSTSVQPCLVYPCDKFNVQKPILDFAGNIAYDSKLLDHPEEHVLFTCIVTEMKDLLSVVAEYYLLNNSADNLRKQMVVPYYNRPKKRAARAGYSLNLKTVEIAPSKSSANAKHTKSSKKSSKKAVTERDFYKKNYFQACETLLSLVMNKRHDGKTAVVYLKKSGHELSELLTQLSASIAGAGITVLFSAIFKVACGRIPLCASKALSTGFGFGLVWLSCAVYNLRGTIVVITKNSSKLDLNEDEMIETVDRSVNEIFFRAATVMAVAVLRFA